MVLRLTALAVFTMAGSLQGQDPVKPLRKAPTKVPSSDVPAKAPVGEVPWAATIVPKSLGWLGFRTDPDEASLVLEVAPGSPAERAGMQPGDRIISSDRLVEEVMTPDSTVEGLATGRRRYATGPITGRTYQITVDRHGEAIALSMVAVAHPSGKRVPLRVAPSAIDSDPLRVEVDAFRTELARTTLQPARKPPKDPATAPPRKPDSLELRRTTPRKSADIYGALDRQDSEVYAQLERLMATADTGTVGRILHDPELYRNLVAMTEESDRLLKSMTDVRLNAISGAEFEQLNPALGQYFGGLSEGVFVLRVGSESPAAQAGLQPGDVIKTVNGRDIATIESLRERVSTATGTITLGVVRKGKLSNVTLRKEE